MAKNNEKFVSRENAKTLWGYMVDLLTGKYTKPSGGIPKSDLESSVQTSLGKADTALQSFIETDPTVPSWAKSTNKPSYTQDEVGDGTTYKRVNQTEKDTWNGKQNAINDLETIRSGAAKGATAVQPTTLNRYVQNSSLVEVVDNGAKNAASINDFTFTASSASGGVRDIEIPCSPLTGYISIKIGSIASTDTDANTCAFILYYTNGSSSPTQQFSRGSNIEVTLNLESAILSYIAIYPSNNYINSGGDTLTVSNLMITTKSQSDISPEYESYALGNQILTPALIEQVDGGAKNILPPTNLIPTGGGLTNNPNLTCTNNGDGTYTLNGSTVANGMIVIHQSITSDVYGGHMLSGTPKVNTSLSEKCRLSIYTDVGTSGVCHETGNGRLIPESFNSSYLAIYVFSGNTFNNLTFYPMICTLADWNVSQKFVPYRPNWDLVSMSVWNYVESAFTSTAADTYQYSGLSVTVPANQLYEIIVSDRAGNTITTGILISDDNTNVEYQTSVVAENSSAYSVADSAIWSRQVHCITPKTYNTARTYYVWVKRKAMGSNTLILAYRRIV